MKNDIMLISSGYDQQIKFWSDFNNSKCKHVYEIGKNEGPINALEMLPNKEEIAFAVNNSVKFLDLVSITPTSSSTISSHNALVNNIMFQKDIDYLFYSSGEDSTVRLNDRRIGKAVKEFNHNHYVNSIQFGFNNVSNL